MRQAVLHVRWQGGACTDVQVALPPPVADQVRSPREVIHRVRELARELPDDQIVERLNQEQYRNATGQRFRRSMIAWIRYRYGIPRAQLKRPEELTVRQVAEHFGVSWHIVYYWIRHGVLDARRLSLGNPYWITLNAMKEQQLWSWVHDSTRIQKLKNA